MKSLIRKGPKFREPRSYNWRENFISIMNAVEDYAKWWAKRENEELITLSEWVKSIRGILKSRIRNIKTKVRTICLSVCSKPEVKNKYERLREEFVLVPADKACNNTVFVMLTITTVSWMNLVLIIFWQPHLHLKSLSKDEILKNHRSVLDTFNMQVNRMNKFELPYLYRIPKLHKNPNIDT
jgi:hypothetical protein